MTSDYRHIWKRMRHYTMISYDRFTAGLTLAEQVRDIPGDIVECGVWRGGQIAAIAQLLGNKRRYMLYDSFEGLPEADLRMDGHKATTLTGKCCADEHYAVEAMQLADITNYTFVKGWYTDTLPTAQHPDGIALLHLDSDWYSSTTECLKYLYPQLNPNAVCIIDDYFVWPGCRQAVHDYLPRHLIHTNPPLAYTIKE